jgi:transposase
VARYADGFTYDQIAHRFDVSRASVTRILRRYRNEATVEPRPRGGGFPPRITEADAKAVRDLVSSMPDASAQELSNEWQKRTARKCSRSSFFRALRKFGYSFKKKSFSASEKESEVNKGKRAKFVAEISSIDPQRLIFLDESGFNSKMAPIYGWGVKGQRLQDQIPLCNHKNISVIGAIRLEKPVALRTYETTVTGPVFKEFLVHALCPQLRPGDVVVMDNLRAHHCPFVKPLIEARDADVLYLPPYSPEMNPIEHVWAIVKHRVRKKRLKAVRDIRAGVRVAWCKISSLDMNKIFLKCRYA